MGCYSGGGRILAATSVLMVSTVMEVHGGNGGGPDVDAGRWNPDGGGAILVARLGNPRRGWGGGTNSDQVGRIGCGQARLVGVIWLVGWVCADIHHPEQRIGHRLSQGRARPIAPHATDSRAGQSRLAYVDPVPHVQPAS
jgi:hypothetical protein